MKKVAFILIGVCFLISSGCNTFMPEGWSNVSSDSVIQISNVIRDLIIDSNYNDEEGLRKCVIQSGIAGSVHFWKNRNSSEDMNKKILDSVKEADKYAEENFSEIYKKYNGLDGIVVKLIITKIGKDSWIEININESEILVSLLHVFVDTGQIGELLDLQKL